MHSHTAFQEALDQALRGDTTSIAPWLEAPVSDTPGLSVYRNTVARGAIDVLAATFSTVVSLVGEDWFRAAAAAYVAERRPSSPSLLRYGDDFAIWLQGFQPAQDAPYLSAAAHLDRLWWDAYFAADAESLAPCDLTELGAAALSSMAIRLHPSVRLAAFDHNLASLWLAQRSDEGPSAFEICSTRECLLVARIGLDVTATLIDQADHAFLAACERGDSLMTAACQAAAVDSDASLADLIGAHLASGVFSGLTPARPAHAHDL